METDVPAANLTPIIAQRVRGMLEAVGTVVAGDVTEFVFENLESEMKIFIDDTGSAEVELFEDTRAVKGAGSGNDIGGIDDGGGLAIHVDVGEEKVEAIAVGNEVVGEAGEGVTRPNDARAAEKSYSLAAVEARQGVAKEVGVDAVVGIDDEDETVAVEKLVAVEEVVDGLGFAVAGVAERNVDAFLAGTAVGFVGRTVGADVDLVGFEEVFEGLKARADVELFVVGSDDGGNLARFDTIGGRRWRF